MSVDAGAAGAGPGIGLSGDIGGATSIGGGLLCSGTFGMLVFGFLGAESITDFLGVKSPTATKGAAESSVDPSGLISGLYPDVCGMMMTASGPGRIISIRQAKTKPRRKVKIYFAIFIYLKPSLCFCFCVGLDCGTSGSELLYQFSPMCAIHWIQFLSSVFLQITHGIDVPGVPSARVLKTTSDPNFL